MHRAPDLRAGSPPPGPRGVGAPRGLLAATVALLPFGYVGVLLAVVVHEVVGHGLVATLLGGSFEGFWIDFDGMGSASTGAPEGGEPWGAVAVLAGGIVATSLLGALLFAAGYALRRRTWLALPVVVVSFGLMTEGISYAFWNGVRPVPPGDVGRILRWVEEPALGVGVVLVSGVLLLAATWAFTALGFAVLQAWLRPGGELRGRARGWVLAWIGLAPGLAWLNLDWDQLAPGIGLLPNVAGLVLHLAAAASLLWIRPRLRGPCRVGGWLAATLVGWGLAAATVLAIALWLPAGREQ